MLIQKLLTLWGVGAVKVTHIFRALYSRLQMHNLNTHMEIYGLCMP